MAARSSERDPDNNLAPQGPFVLDNRKTNGGVVLFFCGPLTERYRDAVISRVVNLPYSEDIYVYICK